MNIIVGDWIKFTPGEREVILMHAVSENKKKWEDKKR